MFSFLASMAKPGVMLWRSDWSNGYRFSSPHLRTALGRLLLTGDVSGECSIVDFHPEVTRWVTVAWKSTCEVDQHTWQVESCLIKFGDVSSI